MAVGRRTLLGGAAAAVAVAGLGSAVAAAADRVVGPDDGRHRTVRGGGGVPLHVVEYGERGARPLLLIHGAAQSWLSWQFNVTDLAARGFHVVTYDLRGHARSGADGRYTYAEFRADAVAVAAATGLDRPVAVGWSLGGGALAAYLRTGLPRGAVFVDTLLDFTLSLPQLRPEAAGPVAAMGSEVTGRAAQRRFFDLATLPFRVPEPQRTRQLTESQRMTAAQFRLLVGQFVGSGPEGSAAIRAARVPVLAVAGTEDRIFAPDEARRIAEAAPRGTVSFYPGAGHAPFMQFPDRFDDELDAFARRCGV